MIILKRPKHHFHVTLVQSMAMSTYSRSTGRRPKQKVYHREPGLDKAMDLRKKPLLMLRLRSLILASKTRSILLRDLEKEVGFVQKWNFMCLIEKHPTIFKVTGGQTGGPVSVRLTDKAEKFMLSKWNLGKISSQRETAQVRIVYTMMSMDCQIPLEKIDLIESELGLPENYKNDLIPKYPDFFAYRKIKDRDYLCLESWDSSVAITAREEKLDLEKAALVNPKIIPKDGNFVGPFAFKLKFSPGFRPNKNYLEEVVRWQKMAFPSPYLNARQVEPATPQARKRAVAVLHELLSLTTEKILTSDKIDAFHNEYQLPCRLLLCLVKNHGIFYLTNKGARSTVFVKEGYEGSDLVEKCPLLRFRERFAALSCDEVNNSFVSV
ncbi:Ubiquitin carboxyl-terminal hydrolase family protein [Rhynchospora pubera]|uniref:Ubiquitin carboxyl-terminal hydrolase family protein n=1 Tax=Rhynchospora pubera TaxID=906938 RepID=A0AAV8F355_9POAL|nr:Ubiquitin carboxyl-terminal hydrolase family protein [Rhynchospora pubera]